MKRSAPLIAAVLALVVVLSSCGDDDNDEVATAAASATTESHASEEDGHEPAAHDEPGGAPDRTIEVKMVENSFRPASFTVRAGETVRFVFHNDGKLVHEAILGDDAEHAEHERKMREQGAKMEHDEHEKPIGPGKTTEVTHTFKAGEALLFGCHLPGHFDAGMVAPITVT